MPDLCVRRIGHKIVLLATAAAQVEKLLSVPAVIASMPNVSRTLSRASAVAWPFEANSR
ncbi:unnamed protein product [marine sediment metagenome]|uniref:Uncharacterized protein n=1 Tax=marine sediment metagenome TaxID=412755 RepID=X1H3G6_9ZZZZ